MKDTTSDNGFLKSAVTNTGASLEELSRAKPLLVVFLRHAGCPFCREALAEISRQRQEIESAGTGIALVHMFSEDQAAAYFSKYGLQDIPRISDPDRLLYQQFGVPRGSHAQVAGPKVWWRGLKTTIFKRHGVGQIIGDVLQMPGAFVVFQGEIVRTFHYETSADKPDYAQFATCELPSPKP